MKKIAEIYKKGNSFKIKFKLISIYDLLIDDLELGYYKGIKRGVFIKNVDGVYKRVGFHVIEDDFLKYVESNFNLFFQDEITYDDFLEEYIKQKPIKNSFGLKYSLKENFRETNPDLEHLTQL